MDISVLLQPRVHDSESLREFLDSLSDQIPNIERDIALLKRTPGDRTPVASLFRCMHSIKGDASMCKLDLGVMIAHPIEDVLDRLRNDKIVFSDVLAEAILLAMDRLQLATELLVGRQPVDHLKLVELVGGLEGLAKFGVGEMDAGAGRLIEAVTGFRPASAPLAAKQAAPVVEHGPGNVSDDLGFFRLLALQFETRSPLFKGRSERLLRLALETNEAAGKPVDPLQLKVAVYMHDIGMLLLPETEWLKAGKLSDEARQRLQAHPCYAAGLLRRMPGWKEAAEMVAQHHEMPDGGGYPHGLKGDQIVPGAKILAIADTFEAVTLKHSQYGNNRSLVRAIAEINACNNQFAPEWITAFNSVVRHMVEG
jgi:HD-GYP domain-containing protein (c-di-GMP phosphodiesterase class II)